MFLKSLPAGWTPELSLHIKSAHAQTDHTPFGLSPDKCPFGKIFFFPVSVWRHFKFSF